MTVGGNNTDDTTGKQQTWHPVSPSKLLSKPRLCWDFSSMNIKLWRSRQGIVMSVRSGQTSWTRCQICKHSFCLCRQSIVAKHKAAGKRLWRFFRRTSFVVLDTKRLFHPMVCNERNRPVAIKVIMNDVEQHSFRFQQTDKKILLLVSSAAAEQKGNHLI